MLNSLTSGNEIPKDDFNQKTGNSFLEMPLSRNISECMGRIPSCSEQGRLDDQWLAARSSDWVLIGGWFVVCGWLQPSFIHLLAVGWLVIGWVLATGWSLVGWLVIGLLFFCWLGFVC